ncbi:MAG: head decoration protein [Gammaproteobacteria bacterium]|nr:head decoration protein [Gammaproteobacteria bacterium]
MSYTEPQRPLEAVLFEIPHLSRETLTLVSGAGLVKAGTVLGQITASGKYTPYDDGFSDGSETAAAISLYEVDATAADVEVACIARLAAVKTAALQWHANVDATAQTAAYAHLLTAHIVAR